MFCARAGFEFDSPAFFFKLSAMLSQRLAQPFRRLSSSGALYPVLESTFDWSSSQAATNRTTNLTRYKLALETRTQVLETGAKKPQKGSQLQKSSVYERLEYLKDPGTNSLLLSVTAGQRLPYGSVVTGATVTALVRVAGEVCVVSANDWTIKGGTVYPVTLKKQLRAQEIAMMNRLPFIFVVDSGGAFLPLQSEIFPDKEHGGKTFRNEAIMSSMGIPQIAVVCGPCTAGGAYVPVMSDEAIIVKGTGSLYLGGPLLVKAATGETIGAEELGGADVHCRISGCTDHYAESEEEAMSVARRLVASLNSRERGRRSMAEMRDRDPEEPMYSGSLDEMALLVPANNSDGNWPMMEVISRIVDGSRFQQFKANYGVDLICGYAHIDGFLVGVVASNGVLDGPAATKGAHFIRMCSIRGTPLIFLQNTPSDRHFLSPAACDDPITLKARGQMMTTLSCSKVAKITIIMGGSYGPSSYAMCSRAMQPNFLFSWPNARVGVASPDHIMEALTGGNDSNEDLRQKLEEDEQNHTSHVVDDGVILPHETRQVLSQCLEACSAYPKDASELNFDLSVLRM